MKTMRVIRSFLGGKVALMAALALTLAAGPSWAATVTASWNPITGFDLGGYRLFHSTSSLLNMTTAQAMVNPFVVKTDISSAATTHIVSSLSASTVYFFRLTAYNTAGQSEFNRDLAGNSVEVSTRTPAAVDTLSPARPKNLRSL
jgi:hypothetical protein